MERFRAKSRARSAQDCPAIFAAFPGQVIGRAISGIERMIAAGEQAARHALQSATERPRPIFAAPLPAARGSSGCPG